MKFNREQVKKLFDEAGERGARRAAIIVERSIKQTLGGGGASNRSNPNARSAPPGKPPNVMTGNLMRSITSTKPVTEGTKVRVSVGTNVEYARIHEYGGIIRPKKGKALPVPIHKDAKRASARGQGPREAFPNLVFIERQGKPPLLVRMKTRRGKDVAMDIMYVLMKAVRMPRRPYMMPGFLKVKDEAIAAIEAEYRKAADRIGGVK